MRGGGHKEAINLSFWRLSPITCLSECVNSYFASPCFLGNPFVGEGN